MSVREPEVAGREEAGVVDAGWDATVLYIGPGMNPSASRSAGYYPTDRREPACLTAITD